MKLRGSTAQQDVLETIIPFSRGCQHFSLFKKLDEKRSF